MREEQILTDSFFFIPFEKEEEEEGLDVSMIKEICIDQ